MKRTLKMEGSIRLCFVAIAFGFVLIINGEPSFATTPEIADPPQTPIVADSPAESPEGDIMLDVCSLMVLDM